MTLKLVLGIAGAQLHSTVSKCLVRGSALSPHTDSAACNEGSTANLCLECRRHILQSQQSRSLSLRL